MSDKHPIVSVTGSSGAGTTSVRRTFEHIFRREKIKAAFIEGDAFHRYTRHEMNEQVRIHTAKGNDHFSHFGLEANLLEELEAAFKSYSESGAGRTRHYVHDEKEAARLNQEAKHLNEVEHPVVREGMFTKWVDLPEKTDLLFYEGLHGAIKTDSLDVSQYPDLAIGVVPVINLEWIQKIHRDKRRRGHSAKEITETILRRMPDYIEHICPQFSRTDINFQRVPTVDTSNPFVARWIPTPEESIVVIRFKKPTDLDLSYLLALIEGSFMSRANAIVVPGSKLDLAMQLILTPMIMKLIERKRRVFPG